MAEKTKSKELPRDEDGNLVCGNLAGQDYRACEELKKKERIDDMPRNEGGSLDCGKLAGDEKITCNRQKTSESVKKSMGMRTEGDKSD